MPNTNRLASASFLDLLDEIREQTSPVQSRRSRSTTPPANNNNVAKRSSSSTKKGKIVDALDEDEGKETSRKKVNKDKGGIEEPPASALLTAAAVVEGKSVLSPAKSDHAKNGSVRFVGPDENSSSGAVAAAGASPLKPAAAAAQMTSILRSSNVLQRPNSAKTFPVVSETEKFSFKQPPKATMVKSTLAFDRSRSVRAQVERAVKEHKIYTCIGVYPAIKKALQKRGWVEKNAALGGGLPRTISATSNPSRTGEEESDQAWMTRVLRDYQPDFIWVIQRDKIDWRALHKDQLINRYPKAYFTTKVGIAACIQTMQWFSEEGIANTFFPRCYRLCMEEEKNAFIDDYRLSACMGLLKWVVGAYEADGESGVMDPSSRVVSLAVDFAVRQLNNYVRMRRHEDIDWLMQPAFMGQHWDVFLNQYYSVVQMKGKLAPTDSQDTAKARYDTSKRTLQRLEQYWPQFNIDGMSNLWICKPGARSRGRGIVVMSQLDKVMDLLAQSNSRESNWVVQKYIERPLLVYKTKFDIRQWFIVTDWSPLTVWFYRESYIRFCTKPFSLEDLHESVHLCNNAIQCRYQNSELRDSALPDENMWDCYTFQAYLKSIGKMDMWDSLIYPGMKEGIIGVLLASQENTDTRKNCFELYGADFMLSEDMTPWLIEINSCPCMAPTTSITARMCAQCLEDTVKVVVDRREDRNADTGLFELIYKQNLPTTPVPPFNGIDLLVAGRRLTKDVDWPSIMTKYNSKRGSIAGLTSRTSTDSSNDESRNTFVDLVQKLRKKEAAKNSSSSRQTSITEQVKPDPPLHSVMTTKKPKGSNSRSTSPTGSKKSPEPTAVAQSSGWSPNQSMVVSTLADLTNLGGSRPGTSLKGSSPSSIQRAGSDAVALPRALQQDLQHLLGPTTEARPSSHKRRRSSKKRSSRSLSPSRRTARSRTRNSMQMESKKERTKSSTPSRSSKAEVQRESTSSSGNDVPLSAVLNSVERTATIADLLRLRQDATRPANPTSSSSPPTTQDLLQNITSRSRPNARTSSSPSAVPLLKSCTNRIGHLCNNLTNFRHLQLTSDKPLKRKKRPGSNNSKAMSRLTPDSRVPHMYNIHRINTLDDEFQSFDSLAAVKHLFRPPVRVVSSREYDDSTYGSELHSSSSTSIKSNLSDEDSSGVSSDLENKSSVVSSDSNNNAIPHHLFLRDIPSLKLHKFRSSSSNTRVSSRLSNHPCYRVALEHPMPPPAKRVLATFPIKTVNLHLQ